MTEASNTLAPHQARVLQERLDLAEKRDRLVGFLASEAIGAVPGPDLVLLRTQSRIMDEYIAVLDKRIALFSAA